MQMHAHGRAVIDRNDGILGRVELQTNSAINMIPEPIYKCEGFEAMRALGFPIGDVMKDYRNIFD